MFFLILVLQVRGDHRSREHIERWAQSQGLTVRSVTRRWLRMGSFWWRTSRAQRVYAINVADSSGRTRSGVVRVGGWMMGALDSRVDVEWSDGRRTL
jgi:hypothetical protein